MRGWKLSEGCLCAGDDPVTVKGRVAIAHPPHILGVESGPQEVIVVLPRPLGAAVGSYVVITGQMRPFRRDELESQLGVELGPMASEIEDGDCLVATTAVVR